MWSRISPLNWAMTPNWDDPAIATGTNPDLDSDRYSLALIFLRVTGAAHFPIQARQKLGEPVSIEFGVPPAYRRVRGLARGAPIWDLCERSLSASRPHERAAPGEWAMVLEEVLEELGASALVRQVWANQEGPALARPSTTDRVVAPPPDGERPS